MKAMICESYGSPDVVQPRELPRPEPGRGEVLVKVMAAGITTGDWRLRASAFPGGLWLPGRLMTGLFRPRKPVLGGDFSGVVEAVGEGVTRFRPGERVFGFSMFGAHAEYLTMSAEGSIAPIPGGLTFQEAASLPFGTNCAIEFLRDVAAVQPGQKVLIVGASGGVGGYAVQIAKWLGAHVTGVASGDNLDYLRDLGADAVVDYRVTDIATLSERFDLIFDTVGAISFSTAKGLLAERGLFLPLNFGIGDVPRALLSGFGGGKRMKLHVNGDSRALAETVADLVLAGDLRPLIDRVYPFDNIRDGYAHVEGRHRRGAVVLDIAGEEDSAAFAV
ncbi:NAD(P)-dependent alcohol dehydrogenase [Nioella aestuarii]|uniref:NAD(P)-dependent alcohol dehydrogenase n=1 Tax=Nioella aestuarii TaxID=1662864 RepID=UPI003D7F5E09